MITRQAKTADTANSTGDIDKTTVFTQIRIDEDTFLNGKILASIYDLSFNSFMIRAIKNEIRMYETEHGKLPKPVKIVP